MHHLYITRNIAIFDLIFTKKANHLLYYIWYDLYISYIFISYKIYHLSIPPLNKRHHEVLTVASSFDDAFLATAGTGQVVKAGSMVDGVKSLGTEFDG